jgi:2-oxo-4-hydroxy-4-carboxy-5-ureidoimidazoline decarboxylase
MSDVLARWNFLPVAAAVNEILPCCGSRAWAYGTVARRPLISEAVLLTMSDEIWRSLTESDWVEALCSHPRIGESQPPKIASKLSGAWSAREQESVEDASESTRIALAEGNREYERRFNRIFIVCATGKSPDEILTILRGRLENNQHTELQEAVEQQRQITQIRLRKWLREG